MSMFIGRRASSGVPGFSDSFDRSNTTSGLGSPWTDDYGTSGITNNRAYFPATNANREAQSTVSRSLPDARISVVTYNIGNDNSYSMGFVFRVQDNNNLLMVVGNSLNTYVYAKQNGSYTIISGPSIPLVEGGTLELLDYANGDIIVRVNGQNGPATNVATFVGGKKQGIYAYANQAGSPPVSQFDNYSIKVI